MADRPKSKAVWGVRIVLKRLRKKGGLPGNFKCRLVIQGSHQIKGLRHQKSSSPTPSEFSIYMKLALMTLADWEGQQLVVELAYLKEDVLGELRNHTIRCQK